ncbi:MAG: phage tail protein I [Desulfovibrio sp.]|nr:phage tail protein I [Desulfovibrio sp.]
MARRLGSTPFAELLPSSLADDAGMRACAEALDGVLDKAIRAIPGLLIYSRLAMDARPEKFVAEQPLPAPLARLATLSGKLNSLSDEVLDLLAWQFHVEGYSAAASTRVKAAMIYASPELHRRRGTRWAVRYDLEIKFGFPVEVRNWFMYGGKPYFFRVRVDVSGQLFDARIFQEALASIAENKNIRSWLDLLETFSQRELPVTIGLGAVNRTTTRAGIWLQTLESPTVPLHAGVALVSRTFTRVARISYPDNKPRLAAFVGACAQTFTRSVLCPRNP